MRKFNNLSWEKILTIFLFENTNTVDAGDGFIFEKNKVMWTAIF